MKIVCKIKRLGGTRVKLANSTYHFKPTNNDGAHVCDVNNEDDISALLGIPEAYYELGNEPKPVVEAAKEPVEAEMSNKELVAWAKKRGFNPKNKKSITDYVLKTHDISLEFSSDTSCVTLIREAVIIETEAL